MQNGNLVPQIYLFIRTFVEKYGMWPNILRISPRLIMQLETECNQMVGGRIETFTHEGAKHVKKFAGLELIVDLNIGDREIRLVHEKSLALEV